jgi:hypothetical protein
MVHQHPHDSNSRAADNGSPECVPADQGDALAGETDPFIGPLPAPTPVPRAHRRRPQPRIDPATRPEPPACLAGLLIDQRAPRGDR